jgi:hypothetical protein
MRGRRVVRFIWFGISILAGFALGMFVGWSREAENTKATFSSLRQDYQVDIVLMISETYHKDQDLSAAKERLRSLDPDDMVLYIEQAVTDAQTIGYAKSDVKLMTALKNNLEADFQSGEGNSP